MSLKRQPRLNWNGQSRRPKFDRRSLAIGLVVVWTSAIETTFAQPTPSPEAVKSISLKTLDLAQVPPNSQPPLPQPGLPPPRPAPQPSLPEPDISEPLPPPEELLRPRDGDLPEEGLESIEGTIDIRGYQVEGSTVFDPEEFDEVLEEYIGEISFAQLLQARSAVTQLYIDNGFITSGAILPPQTIEDGIVTIRIIEGALEDIIVTGDRRLNPGYVRSRLELATDAPLNVNDLLEALQLLQLDPLIQNLSAELSAGSRPGFNLLEVEIAEAKTFRPLLRIDNGRSPTVGAYRGTIEINEGNLFGIGDSVNLSYSRTEGSDEFEAAYRVPINPRNGTIGAYFRITGSEIIEDPFDELDIEADSRDYEISYRQPVILNPSQELALGLTISRRESDTELLGTGFPLSDGANDDGETRLSMLRFFQEWTQRGPEQVFAARSQFSWGIPFLDATVNGTAPDSRFFAWRGQAQYLRLLSDGGISLLLRSDIQLSTTSLVALEQFGLGGNFSVRGYSQDFLLADNGLFASAELRFPVWTANNGNDRLEIRPFFDVGNVWNIDEAAPDPSTLVSVGVGLNLSLANRLNAKIDWGIPLIDVDERENRDVFERQEIYFLFEWQPF
ncbi:MAG: ShlB/FhaC/HecB family hemolysin secretion/activation protein [Cyanobacteria bacterium SID2]|nr:ShlB/FhaC/HecB family hemolysin secretion/activation protein [Cyanobacteria bacterium SID2]MBP0003359.1 ShlB/FhaC/HecB family hemolysin secretion/activation protein [Cyanobacteria bacterium SBC]